MIFSPHANDIGYRSPTVDRLDFRRSFLAGVSKGVLVLVLVGLLLDNPFKVQATTNAAYPTTFLNPTVPTVTGATRTVCSSGCDFTSLQLAWNASTGGDEIVLTAGQTFGELTLCIVTGNCGGTVAAKGSTPILIRSSASCKSTGNRVGTGDASNMAKLRTTVNTTPIITNDYTNGTASARAVANVYFLCLEITTGPAVTADYSLVILYTGDGNLAGAPSNITFDRVLVRPEHRAVDGSGEFFRRGFFLEGSRLAIINSHIEGFCEPNSASDSQGIVIIGGPGIGLLRNNFIDACTENVMTGGTNSGIENNQASDWTIEFNYIKKQTASCATGTNSKNLIEWKAGERAWAHDNLFENGCANSGTNGSMFLLTPRPSQSGYGNTVKDIIIEGNVARHIGNVGSIARSDQYCGELSSTVNTSGTSFTITAGTQPANWATLNAADYDPPVLVNGVANFIASFSSATTGTLRTSAGTQTGVSLVTTYNLCNSAARFIIRNNLFEDIDATYNGSLSVSDVVFADSTDVLFDSNTLVEGAVDPNANSLYSGAVNIGCVSPISDYFVRDSVTNNIFHYSNVGWFADCYNKPSDFFKTAISSGGIVTGNLLTTGALGGAEVTAWNNIGSDTISSGNQSAANYAAMGLLVSNKALDPSSTYYNGGNGPGAKLSTCFDETAITNGTPVSTQCATVPGAAPSITGSRIGGGSRSFGGSRH